MQTPPNEENYNPDFNELERHLEEMSNEVPKYIGPLIIRTAAESMADSKDMPMPNMLFGSMFFENEVTFLFGDTNTGKSILAVQIGDAISKGQSTCLVENESLPQKVLYFDFELSDKQFERRYLNEYGEPYPFSNNFYRVSLNMDMLPPDEYSYEEWLNVCIEQAVIASGAHILIVDNLTYLRNDTERARDAGPLMKHLKRLKARYNLSLLILAHTPKRDKNRPLERKDLQGSSSLGSFADAMFAIGESSQGCDYRYIKQLKTRSDRTDYGFNNVIVCKVEKQNSQLRFNALGFDNENEHLQFATETTDKNNKAELIAQVKELAAKGYTQGKIADELGISKSTVNKYLRN
jgi:hypothetical protein